MSIASSLPIVLEPPPYPIHRFSVEEYHRLIEGGHLTEDDRVELLEGWIVPKMPHNPPHDGTIDVVHDCLRELLPAGWRIRIQESITLLDSEPEPDLAVVRGSAKTYMRRHPQPGDIALVVEVSDTTLDRDRGDKARLYARANIVHYWIVNLVVSQLEVHASPTGPTRSPRYRRRQVLQAEQTVPFVVDGREISRVSVGDLLP